jgi:hypothetical protein
MPPKIALFQVQWGLDRMTFRNECHRRFRPRQVHDPASFVLQPQTSSARRFQAGGSGALGIGTWEFGDVIELVHLTGGLNSGRHQGSMTVPISVNGYFLPQ